MTDDVKNQQCSLGKAIGRSVLVFIAIAALIALAVTVYGCGGHKSDDQPSAPVVDTVVDVNGHRHHTGFFGYRPEPGTATPPTADDTLEASPLPDNYDSRTLGFVPPIKDQGECGSCWIFAQTKAFESQLLAAKKPYLDLAEQDMLVNDKSGHGCSGGFFDSFISTHGLAREASCPYKANDRIACSAPAAAKALSWGFVGGSAKPTVDQLRAAIVKYHVISASVAAGGSDWQTGGHMKNCSYKGVNHLINLVGYTKLADGSYEFIGANSWGTWWGDKGFFYAKQGCDQLAAGPYSAGFIRYQ